MSKIILVTGGNRGIGKEICRQLAHMDHQVIMGSRDLAKGKEAAYGMGIHAVVKLDTSDSQDIRNIATEIQNQFGKLDVLINNAAIMNNQSTTRANINDSKNVFNVNFFGVWELTNALIPLLQYSDEGRIVNISSGMGAIDDLQGGYAAYRLSKFALNGLTKQFFAELDATNIKVNSMCPGWVKTDMGGSEAVRPVEKGAETAVWLATAAHIPNGKFVRDMNSIPW